MEEGVNPNTKRPNGSDPPRSPEDPSVLPLHVNIRWGTRVCPPRVHPLLLMNTGRWGGPSGCVRSVDVIYVIS